MAGRPAARSLFRQIGAGPRQGGVLVPDKNCRIRAAQSENQKITAR
jgi:hypothetical protein